MNSIIKSKDTPNSAQSIEAVEYIPFKNRLSLSTSLEIIEEMREKMDKDGKSFAVCAMIYAMRFLEAEAINEEASQSGYAEGKEAAAKEIQAAINSQLTLHKALEKCLQELVALKDAIISQAEDDLIQLAIAVARKLVCRELMQHPDSIASVVKEAIKTARSGEEIKIRIHPDDYLTLEKYMGELKQSLESIGKDKVSIKIEEVSGLTPGGCIVETDTNLIDMSLEERMESLFSMLDNSDTGKLSDDLSK